MSEKQPLLFELEDRISFKPIVALDQSVFFNPFHTKPHLLLLEEDKMEIKSLDTGHTISSWRFPIAGYIRQIKMSSDFIHLGVLQSAKNLEIRTLYSEEPVFVITKDDTKSDSILGFEWVYQGEMIVLSNDGVQFYTIDSTTKCTKTKSTKIRMNWYHYWPETKLLILSSGTSNLFIYRILQKSNYETYPTLQLSLPRVRTSRGIEPLPVQVTRLHVHLFTFHGHNYVGFLNNWIGTPTLSLYRVTSRTCYRKEYELDLVQSGSFLMNTIDNMLIVHNTTAKQTLVFDIKSPFPSQALLEPTSELFDFLASTTDSAVDLNETDWSTAAPKFIVSPLNGKIFALEMNLSYFLELMAQRSDFSLYQLTEFVIRRRVPQSYMLRTRPLKKAIAMELDVAILRPMFDLLFVHYDVQKRYILLTRMQPIRHRTESATSSVSDLSSRFSSTVSMYPALQENEEEIITFQDDLFCHLFTPLMSKKVTKYHIYCLLEFIESQKSFGLKIKPFLYDLLAHVLIETNSHNQLFQLIQFGLLPDSLTMANLLTQTSSIDSVPFKFGIEMLKRMECHHDVLGLFTESGKLIDALSYAEQTHTLGILKPFPFLEAALQTGNKTLFLNVYRFFEEHGLIPLSPQVDPDFMSRNRDGMNRYISIYREIWGPKIDMEFC